MDSPASAKLLSPEEIAVRAGQQVPFLRLPERTSVFADRELRLRQLAASHSMRDFLLFVAEIARAQQQVLLAYPDVALPDAAAIDSAARLGAPPLPATLWPRDAKWQMGLTRILDSLLPRLADSPARVGVQALRVADGDWLEQQAGKLLNGVMLGLDLAAAPLIAAGLQTYWTHLVLATQKTHGALPTGAFGRVDDPTSCPCCASRPTASITRIGADDSGYRYLHCALCSTQWHMVRIKCTHCESTKGIHYHSLQQRDVESTSRSRRSVVEAESCDECGHYLKIVHMERDPHVEPVADDLATVTLDLLVSDAGFERHGIDLMLLFGDAEPLPEPDSGGGG